MPEAVLLKICREHNRFERQPGRRRWLLQGGSEQSFVPASMIDETARAGQTDQDEWERIEQMIQREVGESENEV